jgi:hypothetical protein
LIGWESVGETAWRELVVYILKGLGVEEATSFSKWVGGDGYESGERETGGGSVDPVHPGRRVHGPFQYAASTEVGWHKSV